MPLQWADGFTYILAYGIFFPLQGNSSVKIPIDCQLQSRHSALKSLCRFKLCSEGNWSGCIWHNKEQPGNIWWTDRVWEPRSKVCAASWDFCECHTQETGRQIDSCYRKKEERDHKDGRASSLCTLYVAYCLNILEEEAAGIFSMCSEAGWKGPTVTCPARANEWGIMMEDWETAWVNKFRSSFVEYCKWYPLQSWHII